mgnify:CR=1 FL=1
MSKDTFEGYKNKLVGRLYGLLCEKEKNGEWEKFLNTIIIELKSVETILPIHKKQLLTYLRLTNLQLGLLINFNTNLLKDGITRIVNNFNE